MATTQLAHRDDVGGIPSDVPAHTAQREQYSLAKILGLWALAAGPMALLGWVVFPQLAPDFATDPLGAGVTRIALLALGLVWQFALSLLIVRREEGDSRWATVRRRLRLTAPQDPATGEPRRRLWLWALPFIVVIALVEMLLARPISAAWVSAFPFLAEPAGYSFDALFRSREILQQLEGAWWFFALFVAYAAFNTFLGEKFLFRACCCPGWMPRSGAGAGRPTVCSSAFTTSISRGGSRSRS